LKLLLHPLPVRIFHWTMFATVSALVLTGLYLDDPFPDRLLSLRTVRLIHGSAGMLLMANTFGQFYYYIVSRKYSEVLLLPRDLANIRSFLRYYLFITEGHPNYGRYNPGQKVLYTSQWLAVLLASLVSMVLLFPDQTAWLQRNMGGLNTLRLIKYTIAMYFLSTVPWHLYLVFTEDPAKLQAMFTGYAKRENKNKDKTL
jgi:Ni/Fe-hydrogenase 1 B-type cytochrome subunit